jgi:DNA invertase Pin-like site-specific DNA recombinase
VLAVPEDTQEGGLMPHNTTRLFSDMVGMLTKAERDKAIGRMYLEDGMSTNAIAKHYDITKEGVRRILQKQGIARRPSDWTATEINYGQKAS